MIAALTTGFTAARIKIIIGAIIVGAVLTISAIVYLHVTALEQKIKKLEEERIALVSSNKILQENVEVLKENMKALADANQANWITAQKLLEERSEAQKAINALASAKTNDKQTIDRLNKRLESLLKDPKNDGIVSPSLRETVRDIQQSRTRQ